MQNGPKLVSLSFLLPCRGVDHAGGELPLHHYGVLAERCVRVDAFAIEFDCNLIAANREVDIGSDSYTAVIVQFPRWRKSLLGKIVARMWFVAMPVLPDIGICAAFASSKPEDHFFRVSDSALTLVGAMVELATSSNLGREIADKARDEVGSRYSLDNYSRAVTDAYHLDEWPRGTDGGKTTVSAVSSRRTVGWVRSSWRSLFSSRCTWRLTRRPTAKHAPGEGSPTQIARRPGQPCQKSTMTYGG
jgi:hypothetical protein